MIWNGAENTMGGRARPELYDQRLFVQTRPNHVEKGTLFKIANSTLLPAWPSRWLSLSFMNRDLLSLFRKGGSHPVMLLWDRSTCAERWCVRVYVCVYVCVRERERER